jgi:hypothetical protein
VGEFVRYPSVVRFGHEEVDGITAGTVHVFPKLDGTNASVWRADVMRAGSRNRELTLAEDNHGFFAWAIQQENLHAFLADHPGFRLFGEWLVPHTLKDYREEAWRRFYVFDAVGPDGTFAAWESYADTLRAYKLDVLEPLAIIRNPSEADLWRCVEQNTYLMRDGAGPGEGVVLKNYQFRNRFGRATHAKLVRAEFKEENRRAFGVVEQNGAFQVEAAIAERYVTRAFVDHERAKLGELPRHSLIPRLLQTVFYELVREHTWDFLKEHRNPTVDFKRLQQHTTAAVKRHAADLF